MIVLQVADPAVRCYTPEWYAWAAVIGIVGVGFYCLGFPLATFIAARRYQRSNKEDLASYERISVLVSVYEPKYA